MMKVKSNWFRRALAMLLVGATLIGLFPMSIIATVSEPAKISSYIPGDANGDSKVNLLDVSLALKHIAKWKNLSINLPAADVNGDAKINLGDVATILRNIAKWEDVVLKPGGICAVSFYDGERLIDTLIAVKGEPLGKVPTTQKSSKANAILVGYFTDPECTEPFYAENPVTADMKVYAKYEDMGTGEKLNVTSFAQMDQTPDISFEVVGVGDPAQAITLEVMDGSDPVELKFEATDGSYIVSAVDGFNEGSSYQLHLADGWTFKDKHETIRTASFSIAKEQVENLRMSEDIIYVKDTDAIDYSVGGLSYDMLTAELISRGGTFEYSGFGITADDIICIYVGTHPEERGMDGDALDPAYYVKVTEVSGSTITFEALGENDFLKLYNIPDNFPIKVDALPTEDTGTVNISALETEMYATMMGEDYDLEKAMSIIEVGDFVSLFISKDSIQSEDDLYFGEITAYNAETGEITYKKTTSDAILESMDLYRDIEISGDDLITEEEKAEIEATLLEQITECGFAEDAAFMLADIITKTDGFKNSSLESILITDGQGNEISSDELQLMNIGGSFELTDDIKPKVEIITKGDQLHYKNGTQIAVGIEAEFEVELEDDEKIVIELNATFVQEVEINPRVKGYVIPWIIWFVPVPVGANVSGTIDIKSFTAFSFEAEIYTVAPEEKELFDQFKEIIEDPRKLAELPGLPEELSKGLNTVGDVFDKIEELEDSMAKVKDKAEQYQGYYEDLEAIWAYVEENGLTTKEDFEGMCEVLDKTSITSDLLDMMDLTNETELETEYYESMEALMERYCEMVEKETDWVTLISEDICEPHFFIYGIDISIDVDFVVRADLSLAIGSNMQYEVGKRFEFWYKCAPFYNSAGGTSMDLIDEKFAFQFYVMGRLGLKAGVNAALRCGIGSTWLANIAVSLELGPYMKFWGFFIYEYERNRPANTETWLSDERMAGAVFMEFGLYLKMAFEAEALKYFSYEYEFLDEEFPLFTAGNEYFYYQPNYEPAEDESVYVRDVDGNSSNGITMTIPEYLLALDYVNLKEGYMAIDYLDSDKFIYTVSNPNFSIDPATGEISVNVPDDTRYMECDLTITYKYGKLAFSTYDMTITVPLVWTNLSTDELNEYYTASVRVGNDTDGYVTVWSQRVLKNQKFDLPTADEVMKLAGWNEYKYDIGTGYGDQNLKDLTLIENKTYDFNVGYDTYSIKVAGVQSTNGSVGTRTYYAHYGETFDFSDLAATGTDANGVYTKFSEITHSVEGLDLRKEIDSRMAAILANDVTVYANYVDDSVTARFTFVGLVADSVKLTIRRGDTPDFAQVQRIVENAGMTVLDIRPALTPITASTVYLVVCGRLVTESATITFEENGGSKVDDITKPVGSPIGNMPTTEKVGYTFGGWYTDAALTKLFTETKIPEGGITLYAKWTANKYTVTLHINGGDTLANNKLNVTYGNPYGNLPTPTKSGYGFIGWFTAAEGGTQITAESICTLTGNQTLYAHWRELEVIDRMLFDFGDAEQYTYETGVAREVKYTSMAIPGSALSKIEDSFTFKFMRQGDSVYVDAPVGAGTYDVVVSRPADNVYAKFEETYIGVVIIDKAARTDMVGIVAEYISGGYTWVELKVADYQYDEWDIDRNATITFTVGGESGVGKVDMLDPGTSYSATFTITNDRNYLDMTTPVKVIFRDGMDSFEQITTLSVDTSRLWTAAGYYSTEWYNSTDTVFVINTAEELAGLAKLVNDGTDTFSGKTVTLGADIDLCYDSDGYCRSWNPIGNGFYYFEGTFDGNGYTIRNMAVVSSSSARGLFGFCKGTICNLTLEDSYVSTTSSSVDIGGLVGYGYNLVIDNCTVSANVKGVGNENDDDNGIGVGGIAGTGLFISITNCISDCKVSGRYYTGGILGFASNDGDVVNCINYGDVNGTSGGYGTGGIVGMIEKDRHFNVANSVNLGSVKGVSSVGGIVGLNESKKGVIENCYSAGTVYGSATSYIYVGAVIGRNKNDCGTAVYSYYLSGSATNGKGQTCKGAGTKSGSEDNKEDVELGYFTSLTSQLGGTYYQGGILIDVLNAMVADADPDTIIRSWVTGPDGYPIPDIR